MVDQHNGSPFFLQVLEHRADCFLGCGIDTGKWLVHQDQLCVLSQCSGDEHSLLLASGEFSHLPVTQVCHPHRFQALHRPVSLSLARSAEPAELAVCSHQHHIENFDRKIPVDTLALGYEADQLFRSVQRFVKDLQPAARGANGTQDCGE